MKFDKKNFSNNFQLIGKAMINDFTFKIGERGKNNQDYIYNSLGLYVFCGEKYGEIYSELMDGFNPCKQKIIYAHGRKEDGTDDFDNRIEVKWEDRFKESVLKDIGEFSFIKIGIEKDENDKVIEKKFLAAYDVIAYLKEHLKKDMVVNVKGNLKYSYYNDDVQMKKGINSIYLSNKEEKDFKATFKQTVLLTKNSTGKELTDKDNKIMYIKGYVLDYVSKYKDTDFKGIIPLPYTLQYDYSQIESEKLPRLMDIMFNVKKDVTEITYIGDLIEGGKVSTASIDDLDDDIREYIDLGMYTEEEALALYTDGTKDRKMVIRKPFLKQETIDDKTVKKIAKYEKKYKETDLIIDLSSYQQKEKRKEEPQATALDEDDINAVFDEMFG